MNCYEIWVDLVPGTNDLEFSQAVAAYLDHLKQEDRLVSYRIRRRKLGFGPSELGEWNISIEFHDLAQVDLAFNAAARRSGELEALHVAVYSRVQSFRSGLYRDFPDPVRSP